MQPPRPGITDQFHADELPTKARIDALDELRFRDFLRDTYGQKLPVRPAERLRLLANMNLATDDGVLNLAGLLLFSERPQRFKPQFVVKAVKYPGTDIHASKYDDTEDFSGPLRSLFDDTLGFVLRNLHKVQAGGGVNSPGKRALEAWPDIDFRDDRDGGVFVATVRRPPGNLRAKAQITVRATAQVTAQVQELLDRLDRELTRSELQEGVRLTHREHFRRAWLQIKSAYEAPR